MKNNQNPSSKRPVLWVTGLAGAGHSTALKTLEDIGYQAIDNLPLSMVLPLLQQEEGQQKPVAIGIDSRTWDFNPGDFTNLANALKEDDSLDFSIVFLDCRDDVIHQRFTETRRLHPLALDRPVADGIIQERQMTEGLRDIADIVIDTSDIKAPDLRRILNGHFQQEEERGLFIHITSFGFKNGLPREADLVFDVRFLDNPFWDPKLKPLSGMDRPVQDMIRRDVGFTPFIEGVQNLLAPLLPRYDLGGKKYLTIAIGCTGGRHRSVCVAEDLFKWVAAQGFIGAVRHRDMESWAQNHA